MKAKIRKFNIDFMKYLESRKQNKQTKHKQTHTYQEKTDGSQMGGRLGVQMKMWRDLDVKIGSNKIVMEM